MLTFTGRIMSVLQWQYMFAYWTALPLEYTAGTAEGQPPPVPANGNGHHPM
jgi:hypothetical protein